MAYSGPNWGYINAKNNAAKKARENAELKEAIDKIKAIADKGASSADHVVALACLNKIAKICDEVTES